LGGGFPRVRGKTNTLTMRNVKRRWGGDLVILTEKQKATGKLETRERHLT